MKEQPARYRIPRVAKWCDSRFGESAPAASFPLVDERELDMQRDIRDPQAVGEAIEAQRAVYPTLSIAKIVDNVLLGSIIRNYGETRREYLQRCDETLGKAGQLHPTRG